MGIHIGKCDSVARKMRERGQRPRERVAQSRKKREKENKGRDREWRKRTKTMIQDFGSDKMLK